MTDEERIWRYVEIDGERYEFYQPEDCPIFVLWYGDIVGCNHHKCTNERRECIMESEINVCPARVIPNVGVCPECGGSGRKHYNGEIALRCMECLHCNGTGKVLLVAKCPECGGSGLESCGGIPTFETTFNYCKRCKGRGVL